MSTSVSMGTEIAHKVVCSESVRESLSILLLPVSMLRVLSWVRGVSKVLH